GLENMGLRFLVPETARLPQLNSVFVPEGIDEAAVRETLLRRYSLEIGAGLGALAGKVWRIGLMGYGASARNVLFCLSAIEGVLAESGVKAAHGGAIPAAQAVLLEKGYR
ncbi:MAG: alanine--glyoxylate aminotransferase family protein, partial [Gammaproteobacteria bacterium]|nr:alanine--glyoxylate aminotransferase family protein [Gammaproteobacteria bacterium]